jgi:hypothetical protein
LRAHLVHVAHVELAFDVAEDEIGSAIGPAATFPLLDHLFGAGQQRRRHFKAERVRGFEVDHQFQASGKLDR